MRRWGALGDSGSQAKGMPGLCCAVQQQRTTGNRIGPLTSHHCCWVSAAAAAHQLQQQLCDGSPHSVIAVRAAARRLERAKQLGAPVLQARDIAAAQAHAAAICSTCTATSPCHPLCTTWCRRTGTMSDHPNTMLHLYRPMMPSHSSPISSPTWPLLSRMDTLMCHAPRSAGQ